MIEVDRFNIVNNSDENFLMAILILEQTLMTIRNILQILIDKIIKPWSYEPKVHWKNSFLTCSKYVLDWK